MAEDTQRDCGDYEPRAYWDQRAGDHGDMLRPVCGSGRHDEENAAMHRVQTAILGRLVARLPLDGARVLELGCGVGRWVPFFRERGCSYTGVDLSSEMLKLGRARFPDAMFERVETTMLPFADASFDLSVSITVLHHNPYDRQNELLAELLRVTRRGGHVLLMEGVTPPEPREVSFNMFPRSVDDWISSLPADQTSVVKVRGARWWPTRELLDGTLRAVMGRRRGRKRAGTGGNVTSEAERRRQRGLSRGSRLLVRLGGYVDPFLVLLVPRRQATNIGVLFRRL